MSFKKQKKRCLMMGVTTALCVVLLMSGTFAWNSLTQKALNEVTGSMNSGGRLHDDFDGNDKDIYVENYTSAPGNRLIVRVRLREYMELTDAQGAVWQSNPAQSKTSQETWDIYRFGNTSGAITYNGKLATDQLADHKGHAQWEFGGKKIYMPTFLRDNGSELADLNGSSRADHKAVIDDFQIYEAGDTREDAADYGSGDPRNGIEIHQAKETLDAKVISMEDWKALASDTERLNAYWVYDTDGWAYWAQPLNPGEATGLLLNKIAVSIPDDASVYYGIYVESQMVTAGETDKLNTDATDDGKSLIALLKAEIGTATLSLEETEEETTLTMTEETKKVVVDVPIADEPNDPEKPAEDETVPAPEEPTQTPADGEEKADTDEKDEATTDKTDEDQSDQDSEAKPDDTTDTPTEAPPEISETTPQSPSDTGNEGSETTAPGGKEENKTELSDSTT